MKSNIKWIVALVGVWILSPILSKYFPPYETLILLQCGVAIILATSLNLINGFTGQFSMGHAGFMAVGAYASSVITTVFYRDFFMSGMGDYFFFVPLLVGAIAAGLMGYLVGLPSLRLKGDYLAIVTLGFGEIIRVVLLNMEVVGGPRGMPGIPPLANFTWIFSSVVITFFVIWRIVKSRYGRSFVAVREDEIAAESMGVPTTQVKVWAFVIGAFFAGLAGGLYAHVVQIVTPTGFTFTKSFELIIMVVLGGMGSLSGSVIAAVLLTILPEALRGYEAYTGGVDLRMVIYSFLLIVLMLSRPQGLLGRMEINDIIAKLISWFRKKKAEVAS
ncbi:MAG: branched-chain amino acid ABC transporter permease [Bdellovibrionota bacterium]